MSANVQRLYPDEPFIPHDEESEYGVVGSILREPSAVVDVAPLLTPDDFANTSLGKLYKIILGLYHRHIPADLVTIASEIERTKSDLEIAFVTEVLNGAFTSVYATYYAENVRQAAMRRNGVKMANQLIELLANEPDVNTALSKGFQLFSQVQESGARSIYLDMKELTDRAYERLGAGNDDLIESGFADLDKIIGGYRPGQLIIPAARPSLGKSSFQIGSAYHLAVRQNVPVGIISLEMSADEIYDRMVALRTGVNMHTLRISDSTPEDISARISNALGELNEAPIFIDDASDGSLADVMSRARLMHSTKHIQALYIDYLQLMNAGRSDSRVQDLSLVSSGLKRLARQLKVPIIVASQLNRNLEHRGNDRRPMLADLRDSGSIEQDADIVIFLHHPYLYSNEEPENVAKFIVAKQRNGPCEDVPVLWRPKHATFANYTEIGR
jgi:replicative DNA helicase